MINCILKLVSECRKRRILVGRVKLYIIALQLENEALLVILSLCQYWDVATTGELNLIQLSQGRGFNLENTRLTDPRRN